jgi:diguanylate cyclase (GGDEF) domain
VLRHIKDLWRQLQGKSASGGAIGSPLMQPDFTISSRQASWEDMKDSGGFFTSPLYKKEHTADLLGQEKPAAPSNIFESTASASFNKLPEQSKTESQNAPLNETKPDLGPELHKVSGPVGYAAHAEEQHRQTLIFEGNLKTMPSLGLLQTISLNNNTGVLEISGKDGMISIYFDNGKPVHAASIKDSGIEILYDFVMQEEGWFRFLPERRASMVSLKVRLDSFLIDAASLFDENKYLKSLGLTMYSGLFAREFCSDKAEFEEMVKERGVDMEPEMWDLYISLLENPIVSDAVELADMPKRQWLHALYKLVQTGMVSISNDGMDDEDLATRLVTKWSYNKKKSDEFAASLADSRTGLLRFEFLIWLIEREFERARTQMWPLSIIIVEIRRNGKLPADLSLEDRELIHSTLAQIAEAKRSIDWFGHFEDDHYAVLTPGLDSNLAGMFAQNFADICSRSLGKLKEGQSDWDYSFGIASLPGDTFEWQKMVGFAIEAQRRARVSRKGYETHAGIKAADAIKAEMNKAEQAKAEANKTETGNAEARQSHSSL